MLPSPNLSLSRFLASLSRTIIPWFGLRYISEREENCVLTLIRTELDWFSFAVTKERFLKFALYVGSLISRFNWSAGEFLRFLGQKRRLAGDRQ